MTYIKVSDFAHDHNIDVRVLTSNPVIRNKIIQLGHDMVFHHSDVDTILCEV